MKEIIYSGASPVLMPREDPAGTIVFFIVLLVFVLLCFIALMTFLAAIFREMHERSKSTMLWTPLRTFLTGLAGYAVLGAIAAWLYSEAFVVRLLETEIVAAFLVPAIVVTACPLLLSLLGAPGVFSYIGDRLAELHGGEMNGLRRTAMGTLTAVFAALFPFIGWFVVTPFLLASSFGAGLFSVFRFDR
ncbi:MAG: hypothetical protein ACR2QZ_01755 [Woeseiaceae bacterium]